MPTTAQRRAARTAAARRRTDPLLKRAQQSATVQYGAEEDSLSALARDAYRTLLGTAKSQEGIARGTRQAVTASQPVLDASFGKAAAAAEVARQRFLGDTGALGQGVDPWRGAAAREAQESQTRIGEGLAGAQKESESRKVMAEQARSFGIAQAIRAYEKDRTKITEAQQSLSRRKGASIAATYGDLQSAQAKAQQDAQEAAALQAYREGQLAISQGGLALGEAKLNEAMRANRADESTARRNADTAARGANPASKPQYTPTQRREFVVHANQATAIARAGQRRNDSQGKVRAALLQKYDRWVVNAAMELAFNGRLGPTVQGYLRTHSIRVPTSWTRRVPLNRVSGTARV